MSSKTYSTTLLGIDAVKVEVEAHLNSGGARFAIVGLPDGVLKESKDRIRCAIQNSGFYFPYGEVIVSLSPAALPKAGANFELAIALSILGASGQIPPESILNMVLLGELSLDGTIKPVAGVLSSAVLVKKEGKSQELVVPKSNLAQAKLIPKINAVGVSSLQEAVLHLNGQLHAEETQDDSSAPAETPHIIRPAQCTFGDVVGQHFAKRALEITAAGEHNMLMVGPPGTGKSMLAQRLTAILPPLRLQEAIELTKIYSAQKTGSLLDGSADNSDFGIMSFRPFRSPHYTVSYAGLVGGGPIPVPGEITLAHKGVLFLDELPEFKRDVLETLRTPLETRHIVISRAKYRISYPSDFILLAAMNPCPCGKRGLPNGGCRCSPMMIERYLARISGPFLDRVDLQVWVAPVNFADLSKAPDADPTPAMRERVLKAREIQRHRFKDAVKTNRAMSNNEIKKFCAIDSSCEKMLNDAAKKMVLSARSYTRVLKVARTIADLDGAGNIQEQHLSEALGYRMKGIKGQ